MPASTPPRLPSVDSLRCFLAAARHLHFRRAAAEVALTPTAFSERIRSLEAELGAALFVRSTRRVELSSAGHALLPAAERALAGLLACTEAVARPTPAPLRLRLGTRFELGVSWLLPAVIALERARPNLRLDLYFGSGPDILTRLEQSRLDAVVTSAPVARADWDAEVLHPESYAFVGSRRLLAEKPFARPLDARRHVLLDVDDELPLSRYLLSAAPGLVFESVKLCGAGAAVLRRVLSGDGVAVLPTYMLHAHTRARRLVRLLPRVRLLSDSFRLLFRKNTPLAPALIELARALRERPLS